MLDTISPPTATAPGGIDAELVDRIQAAAEAARGQGWVAFFANVFGPRGVLRTRLTAQQLERFRMTETYAELLEMLADERSADRTSASAYEPERMITIRIPRSLHDVLCSESIDAELSLNKWAITKLTQPVAHRFVPIQRGRVRGRRFGPQPKRKETTDGQSEEDQARR